MHRRASGDACARVRRGEQCAAAQQNRGHADKGRKAMELGLQGKHAVVTGGSRGIGKAIARELARGGVDVAIAARSPEPLAATARELEAETGQRVFSLPTDVTSKEQVDGMVAEAAERLGGLHIVV